MSKRLWRCFTRSIICSTNELNDSKKNLHDSALKTERLKNVNSTSHLTTTLWRDRKTEECQFKSTFIDNRSFSQVRKRLFTWSLINTSISTMYETTILLTLVKSSLDRSIWSIVLYVTLQFILRISRLVQQHVKERARNKSISRDRRDEFQRQSARCETAVLLTYQEVEVCIQKLSTRSLHHLFSDLQLELHLIVNDLHRMLLEKSKSMSLQQHQVRACSSRSSDQCSLESSDRFILFAFN